MKLFEERKALTESFEKLNRLFREWERNPSALVRDSIKKKLIESYAHLDNLDRIDLDRNTTETPLAMEEPTSKVVEQTVIEKTIPEEKAPATETPKAEEIKEAEIPVEEEIEIEEKIAEPETIVEEIEIPEIKEVEISKPIAEKVEIPVEKEVAKTLAPIEKDTNSPFLSGDDEVELEKYFESQKATENNKEPEATNVYTKPKQESNEVKEEKTLIAENPKNEEKSEEENPFFNTKPLAKNEPIKEEDSPKTIVPKVDEKPRLSSFFSIDEKPKETPKQLTLADKLSINYKEEGIHYNLQGSAIADLNTAIPIAKKFEFIKNLFGDDSENYKSAIQNINNAANLQQALDIIENLSETFNWSEDKELADDLIGFLNRRFQ